MMPLMIEIDLSSPIVEPGDFFHLDALLGALRVKQVELERGPVNPRDWHHDLPVERYTSPSGAWVFKASAFELKRESSVQNWMMSGKVNLSEAAEHRRSGWLQARANKPNTAGGPFKTSLFHEPVLWAGLRGWCIGDKSAIESLLALCQQIGGRRGTGFGRVRRVAVTETSDAQCRWQFRALPLDFVGGDVVVECMGGLRAPYWDRTLHEPVLVPVV